MFDIDTFKKYENFFSQDHAVSFEILSGKGPVMISAPHSVEQTRNGNIKLAERQTGALARLIHDATDCPIIYKTRNCGDDANFDTVSPYKEALVKYVQDNGIRFLIDLHQMAPSRQTKIHIGTGKFKNILKAEYFDMAVEAFTSRALGPVESGAPFDAAQPFTISSYLSSTCGISCLQIELNSDIVRTDTENSQTQEIFEALTDLVTTLSKTLTGEQI